MGEWLSLYLNCLSDRTLKRQIGVSRSLILTAANLAIGGMLLAATQYGPEYALWGSLLAAMPGMLTLLFSAFITHVVLSRFTGKPFRSTLYPYSLATVPAIISWIPFAHYIGALVSVVILIRSLARHHGIGWHQAAASLVAVLAVSSALIMTLSVVLGGGA